MRLIPTLSLPRRFDRLRTRLFLAFAGTNAVLAFVAWLVFSWSFEHGLIDYLNQAEQARLQPLAQRLAENYQRDGSWEPLLLDPERWPALVDEALGPLRPRPSRIERLLREPPESPVEARPHGRGPRRGPAEARLLLFDARGALLVGPPRLAAAALRQPIRVDGHVVGWLGHVPRMKVVASLERLFSAEQNRRFTLIAAGMLLAGVFVSALLADWLTRRIRRLEQGTAALMRGDYASRIELSGHDELARLAADFNRLAQTLEASRRARQQWIADIAHELRTPLTVLRAEVEALQDGVRPLDMKALASLAQELAQLTRLVDDLHLLSMSDLGALSYQYQPLAMDELVEDCLQSHATALGQAGLQLSRVLEPGLMLTGDAARLNQVLANLMQNTLRYTDAPGRLDVQLRRVGECVELLWQDSAPGVAPEDLPRLTERLYRVDAARTRGRGGSGLGLAIAQAIVQAHGGQMQASTSAFAGLCWRITLPCTRAGNGRS